MALASDYDEDPDRFRTARAVVHRHGGGDVHGGVAARPISTGALPVLDVGCGEGELAHNLPAGAWCGVDTSPTMLERAPAPAQVADAVALPFADASFGSVALLHVLYHLEDPVAALREARRVLRPGGLAVLAAPSRHDSPELAGALPCARLTFDAECGPELVAGVFGNVEVEPWDAPLLSLPDAAAVCEYLTGKGGDASAASTFATPLTVTKRGALIFARR